MWRDWEPMIFGLLIGAGMFVARDNKPSQLDRIEQKLDRIEQRLGESERK